MDVDEMLRVDRCRDMDELINFWAWSGLYSGCRNRTAFSDVQVLLRGILCQGKSDVYVLATAATCGFNMVSLSQWAIETP